MSPNVTFEQRLEGEEKEPDGRRRAPQAEGGGWACGGQAFPLIGHSQGARVGKEGDTDSSRRWQQGRWPRKHQGQGNHCKDLAFWHEKQKRPESQTPLPTWARQVTSWACGLECLPCLNGAAPPSFPYNVPPGEGKADVACSSAFQQKPEIWIFTWNILIY